MVKTVTKKLTKSKEQFRQTWPWDPVRTLSPNIFIIGQAKSIQKVI